MMVLCRRDETKNWQDIETGIRYVVKNKHGILIEITDSTE